MPRATDKLVPSVFLMANTLEIGGTERQFVVLARSLNQEAFRVELGCVGNRGEFRDGLGELAEFPFGKRLLGLQTCQSLVALAGRLRSQKIAIAHSFDFYPNLMLVPAARLARTPVVLASHRQLGNFRPPMHFRAQRAMFRLCDCVVCNSQAAAQTLRDHKFPEKKIAVIHNGIPSETFAARLPAFPRDGGTLRVGMVARMNHPVKNYPGFLRAAARLAPKFPTLEVLLVGDGRLRPDLERLAGDLGLGGQVRFLGNRRDVPAILASLDIAVLPSISESLSNFILEAMAVGLPVVATRVGGTPELVSEGETGYLVTPNDDANLTEALERLLTQPDLRARFGARAREVALERFSAAAVARQYEELYKRLLNESNRRHG